MVPDNSKTQQILSKVHRLTSEARDAKTPTDLAVKLYEEAYNNCRELNNDDIERACALNLGAAHIENGNPKTGLEYLHKATPPDSVTQDQLTKGDLYFNKALAYEKLGNKDEAIEFLEKSVDAYEHNVDMKKQCCLKMGQIFCEMAINLRPNPEDVGKAEEKADMCLKKLNLQGLSLEKNECIEACKIFNEVGLVYTQLQIYDRAIQCFEVAVELCNQSETTLNDQLRAVLLQNLGAGYNFLGDYQRSIKFHEDAERKYTKIANYRIGRNGQGQCFMNLAYAYCQLEGGASENAFKTFMEAKKAAEDTDDRHMLWQAYEGLGAIYFNQGLYPESAEHYREAVQRISDQENSKRVAEKLEMALQYKMAQKSGRRPQNYLPRPGGTGPWTPRNQQHPTQTQKMQSTLSGSQERQIIPRTNAQQGVQGQPVKGKRGKVPVRKKDSIGPHLPKVSQGLGTISQRSSVMTNRPPIQTVTEHDSDTLEDLSDEDEETDSDESETTTDDEDKELSSKVTQTSPMVKEIFRKPNASAGQMSPKRDETQGDSLKKYANLLQEKEANEDPRYYTSQPGTSRKSPETNKPVQEGDDSYEDSDEETSDEDSDDSDSSDDFDTSTKGTQAPPLPAQSPPSTALNSKDMRTYVNSDFNKAPDNPDSDSSSKSKDRHRMSPRATTSDNDPPYATIGDVKRTGEGDSAGNALDKDELSKAKQAKLPRDKMGTKHKSENFFDSDDEGDVNHVKGGGFRTVKNEASDNLQHTDGEETKLENLPRGQREQILHDQHVKRQREAERAPPPLPDRKENRSKTCVVM